MQKHTKSLKCITVRQPWATLIATGRKLTEFRSWPCSHRGPLAIHAGMFVDAEECRRVGLDPGELPRGQVIAVVEMHNCVKLRGKNYGWKLRRVRKIRPVKARGKLGLWKWSL